MMGPGPGSGKHELLRTQHQHQYLSQQNTNDHSAPRPCPEHKTLCNTTLHHTIGSVTTILAAMFCSSSRQAGLAGAGGHWARTLDIGVYIAGIAGDSWG